MKKLALCCLGTLALACAPQGTVAFSYSLSQVADGNPDSAALSLASCADAGVSSVAFLLGDDLNANGSLDNGEVVAEVEANCSGGDANADGQFADNELGALVAEEIPADLFDLFAVEVRDAAGNALPWRTVRQAEAQTRVSFRGGFLVREDEENAPPFPGAVAGVLSVFLVVP